jgi:hypothetical protein
LENINVEGFSSNGATGVASHVAKWSHAFGHSTKKMCGLLFLTYGQRQESAVFAGKPGKRKFEVKVVRCKVI